MWIVAECMLPRMDSMSMMVRFVYDVIPHGFQMEGDRHSLAPELELYLAQTEHLEDCYTFCKKMGIVITKMFEMDKWELVPNLN